MCRNQALEIGKKTASDGPAPSLFSETDATNEPSVPLKLSADSSNYLLSTFRVPDTPTIRLRRVKKMPVPEKTRLSMRDLEKAETFIKTLPNPACRENASQLERGFYVF